MLHQTNVALTDFRPLQVGALAVDCGTVLWTDVLTESCGTLLDDHGVLAVGHSAVLVLCAHSNEMTSRKCWRIQRYWLDMDTRSASVHGAWRTQCYWLSSDSSQRRAESS